MIHDDSVSGTRRPALKWLALAAWFATIALSTRIATAKPVDVRVVEDTGDRIVLEYEVNDFDQRPVTIDGKLYTQIDLGKESKLEKTVGAPAVPTVNRSIMIPGTARMEARILDADYCDLPGVDVAPSKGILLRTVNPADVPYTFGEAYRSDAFYPGPVVSLRDPYILRDTRGVVVELFPIQYNPVARTLRVYERVRVEVRRVGTAKINALPRTSRKPSRAFESIYSHHFLNYATHAATRELPAEEGTMLIIAHDEWLGNVQPLVDHKNSVGIETVAVGVSTIGNDPTSIAGYIQNAYDSGDLAYVLLVGDAAEVATETVGSGWSSGASDPSYAKLAGNDSYPDILIGRFSAESAADVDTQVQRTIEYENLPATQQDWFKKGVGIGSTEGPGDDGEDDYEHIDNIRTDLLDYGYTSVDQVYDPSASASQLSAALNEGRGIINYCGHGDVNMWVTSSFTNSNVNALTNNGKLPFIVSVACLVGEYDGRTCFAESWLRATNGGEPTGAVAFYGSSVSQAWQPPMCAQDAINDILVTDEHFALGSVLFAGAIFMMDEYGSDGETEYNYWHIFGDPSLRIYGVAEPPSGLSVSSSDTLAARGNAGGPFEPSSVTYTLKNYSAFAIDYAVSSDAAWLELDNATGTIPAEGSVEVTASLSGAAATLGNGFYEAEISFTNTTDHDGDATRSATLDIGLPEVQHEWPLDEDPGWTAEGQWAFGTPQGRGGEGGAQDPTSGHSGTNVYGYNLAGDYANNLAEQSLTTKAIDCSYLTKVSLRFWRWLGVEQSQYDHAYVRISTDGTSWITVWENSGEIADDKWVQQEIDISEVADGAETLYVQWTMGSTDEGYTYCGWNIDDVEIWGLGSPGCADADGDGFEDAACGGADCNDADYDIRPNAEEICDDNVDNNCDGATDAEDEACGGGEEGGEEGGEGADGDGGGCLNVANTGSAPTPLLILLVSFAATAIRRRPRRRRARKS